METSLLFGLLFTFTPDTLLQININFEFLIYSNCISLFFGLLSFIIIIISKSLTENTITEKKLEFFLLFIH